MSSKQSCIIIASTTLSLLPDFQTHSHLTVKYVLRITRRVATKDEMEEYFGENRRNMKWKRRMKRRWMEEVGDEKVNVTWERRSKRQS